MSDEMPNWRRDLNGLPGLITVDRGGGDCSWKRIELATRSDIEAGIEFELADKEADPSSTG